MEREKAKTETSGSRSSALSSADPNGRATPSRLGQQDEGVLSSAQALPNGSSDTTHLPPHDEADLITGDSLRAVGSASSHESSSSAFSSSAMQQAAGLATKPHSTSITPLTNLDSPSYRPAIQPATASSLTPQRSEKPNGLVSNNGVNADGTSPPRSVLPTVAGRRPARDPARSVRGVKCIYDPFTDRKLSTNDKKKARPVLQEFGLVRTHTIYLAYQRGGVISSIEATG